MRRDRWIRTSNLAGLLGALSIGAVCGAVCGAVGAAGCGRAASPLPDAATQPGAGGQGGRPSEQSPGAIEVQFAVDDERSFCDQITACEGSRKHLTFLTTSGVEIDWTPRSCMHTPSACQDPCLPPRNTCLADPCVPSAETFTTATVRWDGLYREEELCDTTTCLRSHFVPPGHYVARGCATPGKLSRGDAADQPTCTPSGPEECVTASFDLPPGSPSPIMLQLPSQGDPTD